VAPSGGPEWVGLFPAGGLGGMGRVFAGPAPDQLCAVVDGRAYLVRVTRPEAGTIIAHDQVRQVAPVTGAPLLLLLNDTDIVAIGPEGVAWRSPRLAVDSLQVVRADTEGIQCTAGLPSDFETPIVVDPVTGLVTAGLCLDDRGQPPA
jgi:hypothetical protein